MIARIVGLCCILLLTTALQVSATVASAQVFIKPEPGTDCPSSSHCPTISELVERHEHYFTSNTTLHFLTGLHVVEKGQQPVVVLDVEQLTLVGAEGSVVQCEGAFSFTFFNVTTVNILNMNFVECKSTLPHNDKIDRYLTDPNYYKRFHAANIFVIKTQRVSLSSITLQGSFSGIHCINVLSASLTDMSFNASRIILLYINTALSNNDVTPAHATLSNLVFLNPKEKEPLNGLYAFIWTNKFRVTIDLTNTTVDDPQGKLLFQVKTCNKFVLHASNLFLLKCKTLQFINVPPKNAHKVPT